MRLLTAGESHGKQLTGIIEGLPKGLKIDESLIKHEMQSRQKGYGRGARMKIEDDQFEITSGLRGGITTGAPITLVVENKDYVNWLDIMDPWNQTTRIENKHMPRPGHADLGGALKYQDKDIRNVIERSSARETAMRVALGAICRQLLAQLHIQISSSVLSVGGVCGNEGESHIQNKIDMLRKDGDTIGGEVEVRIQNMPAGIGSFMHYDLRLDAHMAFAIMSIQAAKGVSFGNTSHTTTESGSLVHDPIVWDEKKGYYHLSNNAGGIVGGMSNGEDIIIRAQVKPIPTLAKPLASVNLVTKEAEQALYERSDVSVLHAFGVVAEAMSAITLCERILSEFPAQTMDRLIRYFEDFREEVRTF
ncbi:MAG: chorismate synthase [Culicoidibacterales bacterium]